jgi:hypothetical protein
MTQGRGTSGGVTLFSINTNGTGFGLLESFSGSPTGGASPFYNNDLSLSADGSTLYGMIISGGTAKAGVIFSRDISDPVAEPGICALLSIGALLLPRARHRERSLRRSTPTFL